MNVMITGAAGGLGRAMAIECGRRGYNMFLTDVNGNGLLSIVNMGVKDENGNVCYIIGLLKSVRKQLNKGEGDSVHVVIRERE